MRKVVGSVSSSIRKRFTDTFSRSDTSASLGIAADGSLWTALRGSWKVTSSLAQSVDSASTYPASVVTMPKTDVTVTLGGISTGTGALLWASDSANWWAVDIWQDTYSSTNYTTNIAGYSCNCGYYTAPPTCIGWYTSSCYNCVPTSCCPVCNSWNSNTSKNSAYCSSYSYFNYTTCTYTASCQTNCSSSYTTTSCNCAGTPYYSTTASGTSYYYPKYIRILQSVGNVITQITTGALGDNATVAALKASISGTQITAQAFSDSNATTQVGSNLVYTATGAAVTAQYGIVVTPSNYSQGNTIGSITIQ
jgi:hypothetical protein